MKTPGSAGFILAATLAALAAAEPPLLHPLFADHVVLQRDRPIDVWGTAAAGDEVTVTLAAARAVARVEPSGRWSVQLPAMTAGGPHTLTARARSGATQTVEDVHVGDVWLCSGQSNMEWPVSRSLSASVEVAGSANDRIRALTIPRGFNPTPLDTFAAPLEWKRADPSSTGSFSAACYYFARELQKTVPVTMGLVVSAWGGSRIQPWMSREALRGLGGDAALLDIVDAYPRDPATATQRFGALWQDWWKSAARDGADPWDARDERSWRAAPEGLGFWETWGVPELAEYDGLVLYRARVRLTPEQARQGAVLSLGPVDEIDVAWVNGRGAGSSSSGDRSYRLPAGLLQAGENTVVVSALDTYLTGGLWGPAEKRALIFDDGTRVPLATWQYRIAPADIGRPPRAPWESTAGLGTIHNAMIAPLGHFGFRGALWYQGESNSYLPEAEAYERQLAALMTDWRARFGRELPFLVVQLANFGTVPTAPVESGWARVREGQRRAVAADAHAGLAVAIDVGEPYELHPANKQEVGRRLARAARRVVYGERVSVGPQPASAFRDGSRVVVSFGGVDGGLLARSGQPTGFELCGSAAGSCRYADAALRRDAVSLDASEVPGATRVRYGWADAPICTLTDRSGLPAPPFELEIGDMPPFRNTRLSADERVRDLLGRMTAAEKARLLSGSGWMESAPIERLGIPAIRMADGPLGVRNWTGSSAITNAPTTAPVLATAFPASIGMGASWDEDLVREQGRVIAQQVKALGRDMILAPTVNIHRTPLWGRNFEGYGEDPYLAARMAVAYVRGVQGENVIPSVKHFAANNQEFERHRVDAAVDLRALHEIYLPAFRAAVEEAGAWAVMNAYNKLNGRYCSEDPFLLTEVLRKRWGFKGFVISDWGSTYSTGGPIGAGMDLEMPGGAPMRRWLALPQTQKDGNGAGWMTEDKVRAALAVGTVKQADVDESVRRILWVMFTAGLFDAPGAAGGEVDTPEQRAVARRAATRSMVLLKNERNLLPFHARQVRSLAVIGPSAAVPRSGGGSSRVRSKYAVTVLDGIREAAGPGVRVEHALGAAMPGEEQGALPKALRDEAVALAARSDVAVVVVGYSYTLEAEGFDRPSMDLPPGQDELIQAVAAANGNTVVVVAAGAPVTMTRWIPRVRAVLYAWYGGQEAGHAVGDLLFGLETPSGKLPVSFPARIEDSTAHGNYPGQDLRVAYAEGIYVGYRGLEKRKVEPLFPFGFGLSYTTFEYGGLRLSKTRLKKGETVEVALQVRNSGTRAGAEVVQLYVRDVAASLDRPEKELKGFRRVELVPGETRDVTFTLDAAALSFFDPAKGDWVAEAGDFEVLVGASSRDIRLKNGFALVD